MNLSKNKWVLPISVKNVIDSIIPYLLAAGSLYFIALLIINPMLLLIFVALIYVAVVGKGIKDLVEGK